MKRDIGNDTNSANASRASAGVRLAPEIAAQTHDEAILRCPVDGKRLPVSDLRCVGSLVVYCRHCGKGVRISIETIG